MGALDTDPCAARVIRDRLFPSLRPESGERRESPDAARPATGGAMGLGYHIVWAADEDRALAR